MVIVPAFLPISTDLVTAEIIKILGRIAMKQNPPSKKKSIESDMLLWRKSD